MKIAIDLQGTQTEGSHNRGIGRYSLALAKAIKKNIDKEDALQYLINAMYPEIVREIKNTFGYNANYYYYKYHDITSVNGGEKAKRREISETIVESFNDCLDTDILIVTSIFEGFGGKSIVPSHLLNNKRIGKVAILYDLIPLVFQDVYLRDKELKDWYFRRIATLKKCDLLLAISEATRKDAINYLNIDPEKIVNISGAVDEIFKEIECSVPYKKNLLEKYKIENDFIMYTGGIDYRKNIEGLIKAYSKLNKKLQEDYQLVVICSVHEQERNNLLSYAAKQGIEENRVVFTGFVPDDDLVGLYNLCKLFVFPSIYEGFGMPVVEAMKCGAPVIVANNSSLQEILANSEATFDANDCMQLAALISRAITDKEYYERLKQWSKYRRTDFSWDRCAQRALEALKRIKKLPKVASENDLVQTKYRIAFFSPIPPQKSGIATYTSDLLPYLSQYYKIDVFTNCADIENDLLSGDYDVYNYQEFNAEKYAYYYAVIYQLGNSPYHDYMVEMVKKYPGIVVDHDFFLSGLIDYISIGQEEKFKKYLAESHGNKAICDKEIIGMSNLSLKYPLNKWALDNALAVIFHSTYALELTAKYYPQGVNASLAIIKPLREPGEILLAEERRTLRLKYGIADDEVIVTSFGFLTKMKLNDCLIKAIGLLAYEKIKLVFVGELEKNTDFAYRINELVGAVNKGGTKVIITGFTSDVEYKEWMQIADIDIQLRCQSRGETSAALLDCLAFGIPTIVNDYATFKDYPDDVVYKIDADCTEKEVAGALKNLLHNVELKNNLRQKAIGYIKREHNPRLIAERYHAVIEEAAEHDIECGHRKFALNMSNIVKQDEQDDNLLYKSAQYYLDNTNIHKFRRVILLLQSGKLSSFAQKMIEDYVMSDVNGYNLLVVRSEVENNRFSEISYSLKNSKVLLNDTGRAFMFECDDVVLINNNGIISNYEYVEKLFDYALVSTYWTELQNSTKILIGDKELLVNPADNYFELVVECLKKGEFLCLPIQNRSQILIDISELIQSDSGTGIQRVVRAIINEISELSKAKNIKYDVRLVYAEQQHVGYWYANSFANKHNLMIGNSFIDAPIVYNKGDIFVGLDFQSSIVPRQEAILEEMYNCGVRVLFVVYDLIPILFSNLCDVGVPEAHIAWLNVISKFSGVICISQAVANEYKQWCSDNFQLGQLFDIKYFHLGADISNSLPSKGLPTNASYVLEALSKRITILVVSTIEPRKMHKQILHAIELLWQRGTDVNLVFVGKLGWKMDDFAGELNNHAELNRRLFWLKGISDEYLEKVYAASSVVVMASLAEGFGLSIVEGAQYGKPLILRDIPVFREIAGNNAFYFKGKEPSDLAQAIANWLELYKQGLAPDATKIKVLTWKESTEMLLEALGVEYK